LRFSRRSARGPLAAPPRQLPRLRLHACFRDPCAPCPGGARGERRPAGTGVHLEIACRRVLARTGTGNSRPLLRYPMKLRGLYAITPERADRATLLHGVAQALEGGIAMLQYRRKE